MEKIWNFPKEGYVKINVHATNFEHALSNGNNSGIGIVIRDHEGKLLKILTGSIPNLTVRGSELWAMFAGLRSGFCKKKNKIELESDNSEAVREWLQCKRYVDENHETLIQQLQQRRKDPNLKLEIKAVEPSQNRLARYLAANGARNSSRLVVFRRSFGRVNDIWMRDMGLGTLESRFQEIEEEEFLAMQIQNEEINVNFVHENFDE